MTTQRPEYSPTIRELLDTFSDEITATGGSVFDTHEDDGLLIARATLPIEAEIRLNDNVNGGVAIRAAGNQVEVYPYTFRQVCINGAIVVEALQSQRIERIATDFATTSYEASLALGGVRDAVRACASPEAFSTIAEDMQLAANSEGAWAIQLLQYSRAHRDRALLSHLNHIVRRFHNDGDRSAFGLMNAVTSLARDTHDPDQRWTLESIGGGLPALVRRHQEPPRRTSGFETAATSKR